MESLMKPVTLSPETDRVLGEIRAGAENALYGAGSVESEELFHKHVASLIEGAGLPVLQVMHYRWFLRELARLWRTRQGRDLAFHLELCIRKWVGLGLEPRTLQFLVCESYERLKGKQPIQPQSSQSTQSPQDSTTKTQSHQGAGNPEPQHCQTGVAETNPGTREPLISTTKTPSHQENPGSDTRPLEPPDPGTLPGIMSGPRPPADPATGPLESSNPGPLS